MSKIFINLLFLKGGTNLIFLAGSKALDLSLGLCIPKPAIFNSCSRAAASLLASAFNSNSRNSRVYFNSASLKSRACASCASCNAFSASRANRRSSRSKSSFSLTISAVSTIGFSSTSSII